MILIMIRMIADENAGGGDDHSDGDNKDDGGKKVEIRKRMV